MKGRRKMQPSSPVAATQASGAGSRFLRGRNVEDLVYQAVTVAAILLVLGSVWLF